MIYIYNRLQKIRFGKILRIFRSTFFDDVNIDGVIKLK